MKNENLLKKIDCTVLYPPFLRKIRILVENCRALRNVEYWAISGERTWNEQDALYAQGRTAPGGIVTNAKGGHSNHNFAIAADFCRDQSIERAGLQPNWNKADYEILAQEAEKLGLEPGLRWKFVDAPHVQLHLAKHGLDTKDLRAAYQRGGKAAVFTLLDKYEW